MSNFFLLNETLEIEDFQTFINGMQQLNAIDKNGNHNFRKHSTIYDLENYSKLFVSYGQLEQLVVTFIEQLTSCDEYINNEKSALDYCGCDINGFLGIDFSNIGIIEIKQISNNNKYLKWIYHYSTNLEKLKYIISNHKFSNSFEKDFLDLEENVQKSIIDEFIKAKERNLRTPFYPDNNIIKDVTQDNFIHKIMELRIYNPVATRVYFNEKNGLVSLLSIDQKSNANQSIDIKQAYEKYKKMI